MLRGPEAPARNARRRPVSHDGKRIAFASNRDDPAVWRSYVMDSGGSRVVLVAPTEDRAPVPRWSADGKEIFFTNCKKIDGGTDCHIHRAPAPR